MPPKAKRRTNWPDRRKNPVASPKSAAPAADASAASAEGTAAPAALAASAVVSPYAVGPLHEHLNLIKDHVIFANVEGREPLKIQDGASLSPYALSEHCAALENKKPYKCGGNFWWQDILWVANHRVPVNAAQIKEISRFYLPPLDPPETFPFDLTLAVDDDTFGSTGKLKGLQRLSPEEPVHALVQSIGNAIKAGATDDIMRRWLNVCLCVTIVFEVVPQGEERFWRAQNLREQAIENGEVVHRSTRQRIYDVAGFKIEQERIHNREFSAAYVADLYNKRVKRAKSTECLSNSFVDTAITVYKRIFSLEAAKKVLKWVDENFFGYKNPFDSVSVFQAVVNKEPEL